MAESPTSALLRAYGKVGKRKKTRPHGRDAIENLRSYGSKRRGRPILESKPRSKPVPAPTPVRGMGVDRMTGIRTPPRRKDHISDFLSSAAKVIGNVNLKPVGFGGAVRPGNQFGGNMRSQTVKPAKVKHAVEAAGEYTGVQSVRRIRKGEGSLGDYLTVGAMMLPMAGGITRASVRSARAPAFGVISPATQMDIVQAGGAKIVAPRETRLDLRELYDRLPETPPPSPLPRRGGINPEYHGYSSFLDAEGIPTRMPWIIDRRSGTPHVLPPGYEHAAWSGYDEIPKELQRGGRLKQGWLYTPDPQVSMLELGAEGLRHTTDWSTKEQKGLMALLDMMFGRNSPITDDMIRPFARDPGGFSIEERLIARQGEERVRRLKDLLGGGGQPFGIVPEWARPGRWESVDENAARLYKMLSGAGFFREVEDLTREALKGKRFVDATPQQQRELLVRLRILAQETGLSKGDRRGFIPEAPKEAPTPKFFNDPNRLKGMKVRRRY